MNNSTLRGAVSATPLLTQLELFHQDNRPLPLIVAEKWDFVLQHHTPDDTRAEYMYSVQEGCAS